MARRMECPYCGNDMEPRYEMTLAIPVVKAFMFCNECGSMSPKTKLEFSMIDPDSLIDYINEEWVKKKKDKPEKLMLGIFDEKK